MSRRALPVRIHAPAASAVVLVLFDSSAAVEQERRALRREGAAWVGTVAEGDRYGIVVEGDQYGIVADGDQYGIVAGAPSARFDSSKVLVDPSARRVQFPPRFDRQAARVRGRPNSGVAAVAVATAPPARRASPRRSTRSPVVYEAHVRGLTIADPTSVAPGTLRGLVAQLDRLAGLGVSVLELMPVHQGDPQEGSYWGYMPLVFGAVEAAYAEGEDANAELATVVDEAHARDIEVWLDVVFNHTTEVGATGPTYNLRGLADGEYYRLHADGSYVETTGCGNDVDTSSPAAQQLVMDALDRFADLGVDGFRFDLAPVVVRHLPFARHLDAWATRRGVRLVAEPWDAAGTYQLGRAWPAGAWLQWNDRFRDDVRGFLRGEAGLVPALRERVQGSPDLFDAPMQSVNFVSCHDGFTMYDVVAYDRKHNHANGHAGADGASENRSWNCGWEGDDGVPAEVMQLRQRQLRNAWCLLAMSHGAPMFGMGDEFGRTQGGNNNPYNQDNDISWVDWQRRHRFAELERFVGEVLSLRHRHPVLSRDGWWAGDVVWYGADGGPDLSRESRSIAWCVGDLYVMANAWWHPMVFTLQADGPWRRVVDTEAMPPRDIVPEGVPVSGGVYTVGPRAVVVLERA